MKRISAAALAAALAVPAWAQQPSARPDVMTLTGLDGKPHACQVLRTYKHPGGGTAFEVRDNVTGETMTVVDQSKPDVVRAGDASDVLPAPSLPIDPLLQPKDYAGPNVQMQFEEGPAVVQPSKAVQPAKPAPKRWFNWFRKDAPAPVQQTAMKMAPSETVAAYHPDPVIRLIGSMSDDLLPSMREVSAETLARVGTDRPEVVEAMIRSAQTDLAPSVRVCCCRCLVAMQVRTPECVAALKAMEDDREQMVRTAAAAALQLLDR
ncbi:MAG TPA: HEAT repeat domain-containing protein [Gemmataceae bacterium]|jgi:hypothetical protein|nr:HEAT repeat domain-containing protein [Gemmataceae bacterium]